MKADVEKSKAPRFCARAGCVESGCVEWNGQFFCVRHFVAAAREYVDFACSWEAYQGGCRHAADQEILSDCIFRMAALFAAPAELDRAVQSECLRLISFCHGLLRMAANYKVRSRDSPTASNKSQARAASASCFPGGLDRGAIREL